MATQAIKLNYLSAERFIKDYEQLCAGKIFLPTKTPLPLKTRISLNIFVPDIEEMLSVEGGVVKILDAQTAAQLKKPTGMLVGLIGGPQAALKELNQALCSNTYYRMLLNLSNSTAEEKPSPPVPDSGKDPTAAPRVSDPATATEPAADGALTMDWIRDAIAQEEAIREKESAAQLAVAPVTEKKQLSIKDREKAKPSGEFLMDLTKAMLRSGYYASDHPGSGGAKQGLYQSFQRCLKDSSEVMITHQEAREISEITITGILDEPVNVRTLVGAGMAELFVPKLREYFKRKGLVSFAIKKDITPEHFERFVDIMSDPQADTGEKNEIGQLLSNQLVEHGITEISTVFVDDLILLELNLPFRVEMAIQRLAKDLSVMPLFKNKDHEGIRAMKLQIIQDILRPLKHPEFLKDLIINCYLIAQHVEDLETEDIEKVIIDGFPLNSLLATSRYIFAELDRLRKMKVDNPDNPTLENRFAGVKRILKWVSRRLVLEDIHGAQGFLEELYLNKVLSFEELPSDVQYLINTDKMAGDVKMHIRSYANRILGVNTPGDAAVLVKLLRRIMPALIENADWQTAFYLTKATAKAANTSDLFKKTPGLPTNPISFVFKDRTEEMVSGYEKADDSQRALVDKITDFLGTQGIEILSKVLSDSEDRGARKSAMDALTQKGGLVRDWIFKVLDDPKQKWFLIRNALMLLGYVGNNEEDIEHARKFLQHAQPRVRDEALNVVISLKAGDVEDVVIKALGDEDDKVRWRAANGLAELSPVSEGSIKKLLDMITVEAPEDKEEAAAHYRKTAQLIRALGGIKDMPNREAAEDIILELALQSSDQKKGFLKRIKKTTGPDLSTILSAAITTLGHIGGPKAEAFLEQLAASKSPQAEPAQKAANSIKLRNVEQLSDTPPGAETSSHA
ncbi:MAG: HEAT repeat domain-containing protein [Desulfobacteraceae bacterium]|nr:HEAT repeat domain-containing protein [Desulfobacteraceae bacterium]